MGVKFWLQNLHAQFTERSVPVIFSSMEMHSTDISQENDLAILIVMQTSICGL